MLWRGRRCRVYDRFTASRDDQSAGSRLLPATYATPARLALVVALFAAAFATRAALVAEPGPLFLIPTVAAAFWFGRRAGVVAGLAAAILYVVARGIAPHGESLSLPVAAGFRLVAYVLAGYLVGALSERNRRLRATVTAQQRELEELRAIQAALAPPALPARPKLQLASCHVPAEEGAAGDFHLVSEGPDESTVLAVGDVAGKGLEAARRAAFVRTVLATSAPYTRDPGRLLELANAALLARSPRGNEPLVTATCVVFDPSRHELRWALAGHPPPLYLDHGTSLNGIKPGYPLGVDPSLRCESGSLVLGPGGGLVAFTDGLSEARDQDDGELFGVARVQRVLAELGGAEPLRIVKELRERAEAFAGGVLDDDLCVVALRVSA